MVGRKEASFLHERIYYDESRKSLREVFEGRS